MLHGSWTSPRRIGRAVEPQARAVCSRQVCQAVQVSQRRPPNQFTLYTGTSRTQNTPDTLTPTRHTGAVCRARASPLAPPRATLTLTSSRAHLRSSARRSPLARTPSRTYMSICPRVRMHCAHYTYAAGSPSHVACLCRARVARLLASSHGACPVSRRGPQLPPSQSQSSWPCSRAWGPPSRAPSGRWAPSPCRWS